MVWHTSVSREAVNSGRQCDMWLAINPPVWQTIAWLTANLTPQLLTQIMVSPGHPLQKLLDTKCIFDVQVFHPPNTSSSHSTETSSANKRHEQAKKHETESNMSGTWSMSFLWSSPPLEVWEGRMPPSTKQTWFSETKATLSSYAMVEIPTFICHTSIIHHACKKRVVVLTTEWLLWLQTSWGDGGYETFILVFCISNLNPNHILQLMFCGY